MRYRAAFVACALLCPSPAISQHGLRVPAGFEVVEHADSKLANDIYTLTLDPKGRVVVAGRGYIRTLVDDDGDGKADRSVEFSDTPNDGAMGMLWEGDTLYVAGDGGLRRFRDRDGDGKADGPAELIRAMKTGGEHAAHAVGRGPDGWLYVLCGNNTGIDRSFAQLPTSPVKDPVAGCVIRFTPDLKKSEVVADGFRNAYGMDWNPAGELFTFDSDNERCVSLPWYEPTRVYHVIPGRNHGWLTPQHGQFWRRPPYFCDVVPPVATLGRGSPTGVVCYRHAQFPERYRGGLFALDWTFGKVWFLKLTPFGASYQATKEVFLESVGDNGFAPTGAVVHPKTGDLYIAIGGRGTRGAVYRVRYPKGLTTDVARHAAALQPRKRSLAWDDGQRGSLAGQVRGRDVLARLQALVHLRRHRDRLQDDEALKFAADAAGDDDRLVRLAAADLLSTVDAARRREHLSQSKQSVSGTLTWMMAACADEPESTLRGVAWVPAHKGGTPKERVDAVRMIQLALGDLVARDAWGTVWEGYTPRHGTDSFFRQQRALVLPTLRQAFPSEDVALEREVSRTLAVLEDDDPAILARIGERLLSSDPVEQIHYLIVLAKLQAPRPTAVTARTADVLLSLDRTISEKRLNRDLHWPLRMAELYAGLAKADPALNARVVGHADFGRPDHLAFTHAAGFDRQLAARRFLHRAKADPDYRWSAGLVKLVATLPEGESMPALRRLWGRADLEPALLPLLARDPLPEDRTKFLAGLSSLDPSVVRACLGALRRLPAGIDDETPVLVAAFLRLPDAKETRHLRETFAAYLSERIGAKGLGADRDAWRAWLVKRYPERAAALANPDGVDLAAWQRRVARIDWPAGSGSRGKVVFVRAACASCHSGGQAMGPDLRGVAGRFSRDDLLAAIVQPSRDVSARYQTTLIETGDGRFNLGLVVYEAVDGIILQTATATLRLSGEQIAARRPSPLSFMPAGLLDNLTDGDVTDLYAYLRSLTAEPAGEKREPARPGGQPTEKSMRRLPLASLALAALALGPPSLAHGAAPKLPLVFEDDFESGGLDRWQPMDPKGWKVVKADGTHALSQFQKASSYKPPHRSPFHVALVKGLNVADFVLEAKVRSTVKDYGHRDACLFFGFQDAGRLYYVHLGKKTDDHANQIFIVNDAARKKISGKTTPGTDWDDEWHRVRVVRTVKDGKIAVYFDDMKAPVMTATDRTFTWGRVGVGSFDDTTEWDDVRVYGTKAPEKGAGEDR